MVMGSARFQHDVQGEPRHHERYRLAELKSLRLILVTALAPMASRLTIGLIFAANCDRQCHRLGDPLMVRIPVDGDGIAVLNLTPRTEVKRYRAVPVE